MRSRRSHIAAALMVAAGLAACARTPDPRSAAESLATPAGTDDSVALTAAEGRVVNSGTDRARITSLVSEGGTATLLTGPLIHELRSLNGAQLLVRGVMQDAGAQGGRSLSVRDYEVLAIEGQRPHVGKVIRQGDALWLASSDTLRLVPPLAALHDLVNIKIWVVGESDSSARELRVQSYGVIAQPW